VARASALAFGLFVVVTAVVGLRMLVLAARTRRLPELLIAVALLGLGPLGYGVSFVGRQVTGLPPEVALQAVVAGSLGLSTGSAALYVFVWQVFRPRATWARWACYASFVALVVSTGADLLVRLFVASRGSGGWMWAAMVFRMLPLLWGAVESLRYWAMMRRRLALGLADPLVTATFLLWAVGAGSAGAGFAVAIATRAITGVSPTEHMPSNTALCVLALVAAVAIGLAFFPPRTAVRVLRRGGAGPPGTTPG